MREGYSERKRERERRKRREGEKERERAGDKERLSRRIEEEFYSGQKCSHFLLDIPPQILMISSDHHRDKETKGIQIYSSTNPNDLLRSPQGQGNQKNKKILH